MSAQGKKHWGRKLLTVTVLVFLALLSIANLKLVKEPLVRFLQHDLNFENFIDEVQKGYLSNSFAHKNDFVNLNGLFARLTGRRTLNDIVRLSNGMLGKTQSDLDMTTLANEISGLQTMVSEQGIPFLYVQMPVKESLDGKSYPVGVTFYGNKNADSLLSLLSEKEVETLDMRPFISRTPEMLEQYFSKTDHHWNSDGAFAAFGEILKYLHELFPEENIDLTYAQEDQWERHSIANWFLGSHGKRVGVFFGGTDPLIWYTPKFETEMSCAIPKHGYLFQGDFADVIIRTQYIEEKDYFGLDAYCVHIGGDYPLDLHRNLQAPSSLKIMIIKDSFIKPLEPYLATVFKEVDVIDPRHFSECTIAEYVERTKPDMVIFGINPSSFVDKAYQNLGVEEAVPIRADERTPELVVRQDIEIEAKDDENNYRAYPLEANTVYRITMEGVDVLEGGTDGVGLQLYDKTSKTVLENMIFDIVYYEATNDFIWIFRTPDTQDQLELLFYAGIYGHTAGNGVIYRDVTVEKMIDGGSS